MAAINDLICCIRKNLNQIEAVLVEEDLMEYSPPAQPPRSYGAQIRCLLCRTIDAERALDMTVAPMPNLRLLPLKKQACCLQSRVDAVSEAVSALP